ncbi:pimeloyl-ACP methyl ester carboxylesterase [Thiogranum longum]|uniref:Pimeloyl-ACP methyl ester carboxylesterase n=1 Tax=Thiogranum longum TaxID=1537524 RepID=A0A4R1H7M6_9GAMM|nr:alpha/beta fold hydrolase [Thiogranum longum]TCK17198.1 pimeloyl-ACP methyl ester carboxylesterase [Thiogranum longum]
MHRILKLLAILAFSGSHTTLAFAASDQQKEKRWAEQIGDSLVDGETCELDAGGTPFMGIYTEASDGFTGRAVIIAHGMGAHPDWADVIYPLRTGLADHGWATLSIQMPVLPNDASLQDYVPLFDEVSPRLDAAAAMLRKRGNKTIVLIGHSLGATMSAWYVASKKKPPVQGLVLVSVGGSTIDEKTNSLLSLAKITLPVLDIYGSRDLDTLLATPEARRKAARSAGNKLYRQTEVEGADHFFTGMQDALVRRVYGWLKTHYVKKKSN